MAFWLIAMLMSLAALAFVLLPLLTDPAARQRRRAEAALRAAHAAGALAQDELEARIQQLKAAAAPASPPATGLAVALALLLPAAALGLYLHLGTPTALDAVASQPAPPTRGEAPDMEAAIQGLAERLRKEPDNLEGWLLLGRAYRATERFEAAREALAQAYRLAPEEPDVMVEYAEAMALATPRRRIEGESLALIEEAVRRRPDHQRGLWLLGVAAMQGARPREAVERWEALRTLIAADPDAVRALDEQIEGARQAAGLPPAAGSTALASAAADSPAEPAGPPRKLTVEVDIDPALRARVGASDTLFVFARPAGGGRMPVAIQRLPASRLPVTITLDDSQAMMPALRLSTVDEVVVGARISASGQATPQPGDMEALSPPVATSRQEPVRLRIDRVLE
ncbi:MAG: c-type cytochrome biogenesis protein CcmI [Lysobacteraceae bacterium]|nr:MAG: c-type cytochrome biogenesis protein CcmI [Xanthomonadaceae bacterium]